MFTLTLCVFQFHKGTIKTAGETIQGEVLRDFNSIKVRLKRYGSNVYVNPLRISIP